MTAPLYSETINKLMCEYQGGVQYGENSLKLQAKTIFNNGFFGSAKIVYLDATDSITHQAPGCIAAPKIVMKARKLLQIGVHQENDSVRIYAPKTLSIETSHLSVGKVRFIGEPEEAIISCSKLTLSKYTEEEPAYFEIVKSWINDEAEIKTIRQ